NSGGTRLRVVQNARPRPRDTRRPVDVLDVDQFVPLPQDLMLNTEQFVRARPGAPRAYLCVLKRVADYEFTTKNSADGDAAQAKYAPESVLDTTFRRVAAIHARTDRAGPCAQVALGIDRSGAAGARARPSLRDQGDRAEDPGEGDVHHRPAARVAC